MYELLISHRLSLTLCASLAALVAGAAISADNSFTLFVNGQRVAAGENWEAPETVVLEVVEADAHIKGQTATSSYKAAKLENGLRVLVPPFISSGEKIVVSTDEVSYVKRAE